MTKFSNTRIICKAAPFALVCVLNAGCATAEAMAAEAAEPAHAAETEGQADPGYTGPKKSIAVAGFTANAAFYSRYGGWEQGGGLAAMLESELKGSERFRIVNRTNLDATFYEQELNESGLTARRTARAGQLIGAQYLVTAAVTEFTMAEKGGGLSVGGSFGGVLGSISPRTQKGRIAIDFSVVDSTTGEVVASFPVEKKLKSTAIAANVTRKGVSVGGDTFENSPLGKAAREVMEIAADHVAAALESKAWTAHVAQVRPNALYVNAGADSGLKSGDRLVIERVVDRIEDPMTGALLGIEKQAIGEAVVVTVDDQYSTAQYSAAYAPQPGDRLILQEQIRLSYQMQ